MDKGDIYTLIGGFVVILVVAVIANHGLISPSSPTTNVPTVSVTQVPVPSSVVQTPTVPPTLQLPVPYQIILTTNPFSYPVIHLPDHMETYGVSNTPRGNVNIPFAYVEDSRGGLTTIFKVPYAVWALNISVTANTHPQYATFDMVLCDAKTGSIITGSEILNGGTMYKIVRTSGSVYMIIGVNYVDDYRITLETPISYFENASSQT
ncbi:MAG: hypothetical protein WCC86_00915 [Methanoregula sp.]|uniref:hypothetical protein n=1 Tax=Methanoregula sp. TaxID=2052170 RepID=UPI003BAE406A